MRGHLYTPEEKKRAREYVVAGKSYNEIYRLLGIPKSTISTWFGKTIKRPVDKNALSAHLARIRKLARVALKERWRRIKEEENKIIDQKIGEIKNLPLEDIGFNKSLLAMLYWAEGSKGSGPLEFVNTDPDLMVLYITLLRKCYNIDEDKFRVRLRVHYYHQIKKLKIFWSKLLGIPISQFGKIFIKRRSLIRKFRKNPAGICSLRYKDSLVRKELLKLGLTLRELIVKNK